MTTKQNIYLLMGIFTGMSALLVAFVIYPVFKDIQKGSADILLQRGEALSAGSQNKDLDTFKKEYQDYKPNLDKVDALFVNPNDPIDFIKFLEKAAVDTGVSTNIDLNPSGQGSPDTWPTSVFNVTINGSFLNLLAFSEKIETGPYLVTIQNMSLQKQQADAGKEKTGGSEIEGNILLRVATN